MKTDEKLNIECIQSKDLRFFEGNSRQFIDPEGIRILSGLVKEHRFRKPSQVYLRRRGIFHSVRESTIRGRLVQGKQTYPRADLRRTPYRA